MDRSYLKFARIIAVLLLFPLIGELVFSYVEGSNYNAARAVGVLGVFSTGIVAFVLVALLRKRGERFQHLLVVALCADGLVSVGLGVWIVLREGGESAPGLARVIGIVVLASGAFILIAAAILYKWRSESVHLPQRRQTGSPSAPASIHRLSEHIVSHRYREGPKREQLLSQSLDLAGLHYVAYYAKGRCQMYIDILEHPDLGVYFEHGGSPADRRARYWDKARQLSDMVGKLDASMRDIESGVLIRLVLDVEKGAIYYNLIDNHRGYSDASYVFGVTLTQAVVDEADKKMAQLANQLRTMEGLPPINQIAEESST